VAMNEPQRGRKVVLILRTCDAQIRAMFIRAARERLEVPAWELLAKNSVVTHLPPPMSRAGPQIHGSLWPGDRNWVCLMKDGFLEALMTEWLGAARSLSWRRLWKQARTIYIVRRALEGSKLTPVNRQLSLG
jgi:hypothetical protein